MYKHSTSCRALEKQEKNLASFHVPVVLTVHVSRALQLSSVNLYWLIWGGSLIQPSVMKGCSSFFAEQNKVQLVHTVYYTLMIMFI